MQPRLTSNSSVALRDAALLGFGIACLPTYLVASDIVRGDLKLVLFGFQSAIVHSLYAMYFRSKYANPLIRSFIDYMVDEFGSVPAWDRALDAATMATGAMDGAVADH